MLARLWVKCFHGCDANPFTYVFRLMYPTYPSPRPKLVRERQRRGHRNTNQKGEDVVDELATEVPVFNGERKQGVRHVRPDRPHHACRHLEYQSPTTSANDYSPRESSTCTHMAQPIHRAERCGVRGGGGDDHERSTYQKSEVIRSKSRSLQQVARTEHITHRTQGRTPRQRRTGQPPQPIARGCVPVIVPQSS